METQSFFKILGALGTAFALTLAACGSKDNNLGEQVLAVAGEECSPVGSSLPSEDGCNTCQCTAAGTWACTLRDCQASCVAGEQKPAGDGCNTCTCDNDGDWACTDMACNPAPECTPGSTRPADDGCNSCGCVDGRWTCTLIDCAPDPVCDLGSERPADDGCNTCTCTGDGWACTDRACEPPTTCTPGAQRPADDGCNTCTCTESGGWACTEKACEPTTCTPGEQQPSEDGCNTCTCLQSGDWGCTKKACPELCTPGDTKKMDCNDCFCDEEGQWGCTLIACDVCPGPSTSARPADLCATVVTWAKDPESGGCCQYGSPCSAPTGWKQFGTEEACEKAPSCPASHAGFAPDQPCAAVLVWAKDPASGGCCQYPDPCSAPEGWEQFYTPAACEAAP
jgi:hypothetical protein